MQCKTIGILGGMGPAASAKFYRKIINYCQEEYGAVQDTDFPPMVLYSLPLQGFDESGIVNEHKVLKQLTDGITVLESANCDFIVIPCNTVHCFIEELRKNSSVPILSIIEETAKQVNRQCVGLLGSETTLHLGLYQNALKKRTATIISPEKKEINLITKLIFEVMSGNRAKKTKEDVLAIAKRMKSKGANAIILGCTELPLAIKQKDTGIPLYDTLQILAESTAHYAMAGAVK